MCFSSTLLPEPLGPMMTKISPGRTARSTSLSTATPSKLLWSFSMVTPKVLAGEGSGGNGGHGALQTRALVTK